MRSISRLALELALLMGIVLLCGRVNYAAADDSKKGLWKKKYPNVTLKTQDNKELRFYENIIKGKCVVINFMYTTCDGELCTKGIENLKEVQAGLEDLKKHLGYEVFMYSITLDPKTDTPEVLKDYATTHNAKWTFLTGRPEDIEKIRLALGQTISDAKKDAERKNHTGLIQILYEPTGKKQSISVMAKPQRIWGMIERVCTR